MEAAGATGTEVRVEGHTAENALIRVTVNGDGTVDVEDKRSGVRYSRCGELEDVGDVGDEYNYSPPASDRPITSANLVGVRVARVDAGPLRASFRIDGSLPLPAAISPDRAKRGNETIVSAVSITVAIAAGSPRVDWRLTVDNRSADHRLRLLFPTGADAITHVRAETAFGVAHRPARRERPEQVKMEVPVSYGPTGAFTEGGSGNAGAILFGEGLSEYEAVTDDDGRVSKLALTLLRCVGYLSREDLVMRPSGHAGPGLATPGAQCLGRHEFRVAFEPRGKTPSNGALFRRASSFIAPPLVVTAVGSGGRQPSQDTFLQIDAQQGDVVLSACHRAEDHDGILVRMFNADATPAAVRVALQKPVKTAAAVDFLERERDTLEIENGAVRAAVPPYGIVTLCIT
jgi:alpha-mannosidase